MLKGLRKKSLKYEDLIKNIEVLFSGGIGFIENHLLPFIIISTSIVGSLFLIRIYIKSEISDKEIEMGKEFREDMKEIYKTRKEYIKEFYKTQQEMFDKQNARFDKQDKLIEEKFEEIKQLLKNNQNQQNKQ